MPGNNNGVHFCAVQKSSWIDVPLLASGFVKLWKNFFFVLPTLKHALASLWKKHSILGPEKTQQWACATPLVGETESRQGAATQVVSSTKN